MALVFYILGTLLLGFGLDLQHHNRDFAESFTGRKLKEYGGYEYGLLAYEHTAQLGLKTARWMAENGPVFANSTITLLKPYAQLSRDITLIAFNVSKRVAFNVESYFHEYYPAADYWYVYYLGFCMLPGPIAGVVQGYSLVVHLSSVLPKKGQARENLPDIRDSIGYAITATQNGAAAVFKAATTHGGNAATYLRENVFVGSMSPENLKKSSAEAYDTTQKYLVNTWSWVVNKIQEATEEKKRT